MGEKALQILLELLVAGGLVVGSDDAGKSLEQIMQEQPTSAQQSIVETYVGTVDNVAEAFDGFTNSVVSVVDSASEMVVGVPTTILNNVIDGVHSVVGDYNSIGTDWNLTGGYMSGDMYILPNGNYVTFDAKIDDSGGTLKNNGDTYYMYRPYFTLYSADGEMISSYMALNSLSWGLANSSFNEVYKNVSVIDGGFSATFVGNAGSDLYEKEGTIWCDYMINMTSSDVVTDSKKVLTDENGDPIVDLNDSTAPVDPNALTPEQLQKLFQDIITVIENNNNEENNNYEKHDYSNILEKILAKLKDIFAEVKKIPDKLNDVIKEIKNINKTLDDMTEEEKKTEEKTWKEFFEFIKKKFDYADIKESIENISSGVFGTRLFSVNEKGSLNVAIASVGSTFSGTDWNSIAFDTAFSGNSIVTLTQPHLYFTFMGRKYDLFASIASFDNGTLNTFKSFVAFFLNISFLLGLFRSLPNILMSAGNLVGIVSYPEEDTTMMIGKSTGRVYHTWNK